MLELVDRSAYKRKAVTTIRRALKSALPFVGTHTVGYQGANVPCELYAAGDGRLWFFPSKGLTGGKILRHSNSFGVYRANAPSQDIAVEINVPAETNTTRVTGFFARDPETDTSYLMHTGKLGGGRKGIGKRAFLEWSGLPRVEVLGPDGTTQKGIVVTSLKDDVAGRIWRFVRTAAAFKAAVKDGSVSVAASSDEDEKPDAFNGEFSGWKSGTRSCDFEYLSYHGDIVEALRAELMFGDASLETVVANTGLIDLYVHRAGEIEAIYEVKTKARRQWLYTAIGQLMTHSAAMPRHVVKWLVLPADEEMPDDLRHAIRSLDIRARYFRLIEQQEEWEIELLSI